MFHRRTHARRVVFIAFVTSETQRCPWHVGRSRAPSRRDSKWIIAYGIRFEKRRSRLIENSSTNPVSETLAAYVRMLRRYRPATCTYCLRYFIRREVLTYRARDYDMSRTRTLARNTKTVETVDLPTYKGDIELYALRLLGARSRRFSTLGNRPVPRR